MWTDNEKQILIENYPIMTTSELMILLNKSEGQIRGMKERLGPVSYIHLTLPTN